MKKTLLNALTLILLSVTCATAARGAAPVFPAASVLASGRWVKVKVDSTGVQRIPYETLRSWGFGNPSKVAVYGYGSVEMSLEFKSHPTDLPAVAVAHGEDALFFYGEGDTRYQFNSMTDVDVYTNRYSRGSYYFLSEDAPATEIASTPFAASGSEDEAITGHVSLAAHYPREFNPSEGGAFWYSRDITDKAPYHVTFRLTDCTGSGRMGYKVVGKHTELNYMTPAVTASEGVSFLHNSPNRIYRSNNEKEVYRYMNDYNVSSFTTATGSSEVTFTFRPDPETDVTLMCVDNLWVAYDRSNIMTDKASALSMHFLSTASGAVKIKTEGGEAPVVWDVTAVGTPVRLSTEPATDGVLFDLPASQGTTRHIETFYPASSHLPEPEFAGEVPNTNIHAITGGYDMVILCAAEFTGEARRLADAHAAKQGLNVLVVNKEDVLNEFGGGNFTPNGIRLMSKMLFDRDNRYRYLLLIGDAFYDNAKVASLTNPYLPCYQTELQSNAYNVAKAYTCDSFFGFVEDEIAPDMSTRVDNSTPRVIDIAVGRLPAYTLPEVSFLVDKSIAYLNNPVLAGDPEFAVMMADKGNENQHMQGMEASVREYLAASPGMTVSRCYDAAYDNTAQTTDNLTLIKHIKSGLASNPAIVSYAGHGGKKSMFSEAFITRSFLEGLHYGSASMFLSASCHPYTFDYDYRGMLADLLFIPDGGSTMIIGPAREVYLKNNQEYCNMFARCYSDVSARTIGEVFRNTMTLMQEAGQSVRTNALSYNLGGDPALPLPRVTARVTLDKGDEEVVTLHPGRRTLLSGSIVDADGAVITDFSGTVNVKIFDNPRTFESFANVAADRTDRLTLTLDETIVAEVDGTVTDGHWEAWITAPALGNDNGVNRIALLARRPDSFDMAAGYSTDFTVAEYNEALVTPDDEAPVLNITVNDALMAGDRVETSHEPEITISVTDLGSGIYMNRSGVGGVLTASLDGNSSIPNLDRMLRPDGEGGYSVTFSPGTLTDGRHTISARVADNAGNTASGEIDFYVVEPAFDCVLEADRLIARDEVTFSLSHSLLDSPSTRVVVENIHGEHVLTADMTGESFIWNLSDASGQRVPDGTYRVYAIAESHPRYSASRPVSLTVIR